MDSRKFLFCSSSGSFEIDEAILTNAVRLDENLVVLKQIGSNWSKNYNIALATPEEREFIEKQFAELTKFDEQRLALEKEKNERKAILLNELSGTEFARKMLDNKEKRESLEATIKSLKTQLSALDTEEYKLKQRMKDIEKEHELEVGELFDEYLKKLNIPHFEAGNILDTLVPMVSGMQTKKRATQYFSKELKKCDKVYRQGLRTKKNGELTADSERRLTQRKQVKHFTNVDDRTMSKTLLPLEILLRDDFEPISINGVIGIWLRNRHMLVFRPTHYSDVDKLWSWGDDITEFKSGQLERFGYVPTLMKDEGKFIQLRTNASKGIHSSSEKVKSVKADNKLILALFETFCVVHVPYDYEKLIRRE